MLGPIVFVFFLIFLSPEIIFSDNYLSTIYIDSFVGLVAGAGYAFLFWNNNVTDVVSFLYILLTISILVLSKDVGLLFAIFLAASFLIQIFLFRGTKSDHRGIRAILLCCCTVFAVALPKICWNIHLKIWGISKAFSSPIKMDILWSVLNGTDQTYRATVLQNYKEFFFHAKPVISWFNIEFSYLSLLFCLTVIMIAILFVAYSVSSKAEKISRTFVSHIVFFQTLFYVFGLLIIYLFRFSKSEAINLASAYRYLGIPILAILVMILLICLERFPSMISLKRFVTICLLLAVLCFSCRKY